MVTDLGSLDLLGEIPGITSFDELADRAEEVILYGHRLRVASVADLIAMKRAANRPKDQIHLQQLEYLKGLEGDETS